VKKRGGVGGDGRFSPAPGGKKEFRAPRRRQKREKRRQWARRGESQQKRDYWWAGSTAGADVERGVLVQEGVFASSQGDSPGIDGRKGRDSGGAGDSEERNHLEKHTITHLKRGVFDRVLRKGGPASGKRKNSNA